MSKIVKTSVAFQITREVNDRIKGRMLSSTLRMAEKLYYEDKNSNAANDAIYEARKTEKIDKCARIDFTIEELKQRASEKGYSSYSKYIRTCLSKKIDKAEIELLKLEE